LPRGTKISMFAGYGIDKHSFQFQGAHTFLKTVAPT